MAMLRSLAIKTLACWGILTILFCGLLVAAYAIPVSLVERNAVSSALTNVSDESAFGVGADPSRWASTPTVWVMLSMATHDDGGLLESAMAGAYYESEEGISDIGIGERANRTYEWYWHGWLVVLKPLLVFFDYAAIKKVFAVVCVGLLVALCVSADRKLPRGGVLPGGRSEFRLDLDVFRRGGAAVLLFCLHRFAGEPCCSSVRGKR